eukprot:7130381-Pyramimonas_sp.AAC.1
MLSTRVKTCAPSEHQRASADSSVFSQPSVGDAIAWEAFFLSSIGMVVSPTPWGAIAFREAAL